MSVIIRLQNLPWAANARDIRNFFAGLSIPEGGVHIIGGEMGDAFIAFSTDEDARKGMLKDREKLMETQVRLLLSSRAEMQKVIETARQQSILAKANTSATSVISAATTLETLPNLMPAAPNPPMISVPGLQTYMTQPTINKATSFMAYQQQAGITLTDTLNVSGVGDGIGKAKKEESPESTRRSNSRERRLTSRDRDRDRGSSRRSSRRSRDRSRSWSNDRERDIRGSGRGGGSGRNDRDRRRDSSHERSRERSQERGRDRSRGGRRNSRDRDISGSRHDSNKPKVPVVSPWSTVQPTNANDAFKLNANTAVIPPGLTTPFSAVNMNQSVGAGGVVGAFMANKVGAQPNQIPGFQSYTTSTTTTNNYSINLIGGGTTAANSALSTNDASTPITLQNPYLSALSSSSGSNSPDAIPGLTLGTQQHQQPPPLIQPLIPTLLQEQKSELKLPQNANTPPQGITLAPPLNIGSQQIQLQQQLPQEPIAFANVNPYAQIYPQLFEQAAARNNPLQSNLQTQQQNQNRNAAATSQNQSGNNGTSSSISTALARTKNISETCYVRISNMCNTTTYSDLRKFFAGLYIPHNGIKIINDNQGQRMGVAFIEFSRVSSAQKAVSLSNTMFKNKLLYIELITHDEFEKAEDSYRPGRPYDLDNSGGGGGNGSAGGIGQFSNSTFNQSSSDSHFATFNILYLEELPQLATEQDIMKIFSSYTIVDILLSASPHNRREQVAYVQFSQDSEARAALMDVSRHAIGYRKIHVRAGSMREMQDTKEKLRLANEQLMKEEEDLARTAAAADNDDTSMELQTIQIDDSNDSHGSNMQLSDNGFNAAFGISADSNSYSNNSNMSPQQMNGVGGGSNQGYNIDPRRRGQQEQFQGMNMQQQQQQQHRQQQRDNYNNNQNNQNRNDGPFMSNYNSNQGGGGPMPYQMNSMDSPMMMNDEEKYVLVKNCEYATCINDIGEWLASEDLRMNHIEMLYNDRKLPAGEFIIEFVNSRDANRAVHDFHNRRFRGRSIRFLHITPQDIADRLCKPFTGYIPGGNGRRLMNDGNKNNNYNNNNNGGGGNVIGGNNGAEIVQAALELINRSGLISNNNSNNNNMNNSNNKNQSNPIKRSRFGPSNDNNGPMTSQQHQQNSNNTAKSHRNPFADNNDRSLDADNDVQQDGGRNDNNNDDNERPPPIDRINDNNNADADDGIPDKFNRPGCVVAMRNVPFKANLKDILRFFGDYELNPEDIIRRFNDDGTPTGDARVAFDSPAQARSAYESKRRRQIFNRTIYLSVL